MKIFLLTSVLLISTMFILMPVGYTGNPPIDPAIETLMGPAIVGTFTAYPTPLGTTYSFQGNCKGESVAFDGNITLSYETITAESLENFRVGVPYGWSSSYPSCNPAKYTEYFIINTVIRFNKTDSLATADMVIMFVIPKR